MSGKNIPAIKDYYRFRAFGKLHQRCWKCWISCIQQIVDGGLLLWFLFRILEAQPSSCQHCTYSVAITYLKYTQTYCTQEKEHQVQSSILFVSERVSVGPKREYDTSSVSVRTSRHVPLLIKLPRQWKRESPGSWTHFTDHPAKHRLMNKDCRIW